MIIRVLLVVAALGLVAALVWWLWGPGSLEREVRRRARKAASEDFAREVKRWD